MNPIQQLIFALIATNAGGEGKTTLALLLKALWGMARHPSEILDGDNGNRAALKADNTVGAVGWGAGPDCAPDMFQSHKGKNAIFDLGANALASKREIADLVPELGDVFAEGDYRCVAIMPLSTNKMGAGGALLALGESLTQFEKIYVRVNRDLSNCYDPDFKPASYVDLGHLAPGFQQYIRDLGGSMAQAVLEPPPGYRNAASYVAHWMLDFVTQPAIAELFGPRPAEVILNAYPEAPPTIRFQVLHLSEITDEALVENARQSKILDAIDRKGWTADGLLLVATLLAADAI